MATLTTVLTTAYEPQSGVKNGKQWTRSDFKDQNGTKFAAFNGGVASAAKQFLNQPVVIEYTEQQNGEYTNRTLTSVKAVNGAEAAPQVTYTHQTETASNGSYNGSYAPSDKDERIARAVALKAAIEVFTAVGQDPLLYRSEMLEYAETLIPWLQTGVDTKATEPVEA